MPGAIHGRHQQAKQPAVYIMANRRNGALYTGVTANLVQRVSQHKEGLFGGFTRKYCCKTLVYFEVHDDMATAIAREKQIKGWLSKEKAGADRGREWGVAGSL